MRATNMFEIAGRRKDTLEKLCQRDYYVSDLANDLKKTKPEAFKYLKELAGIGLVKPYRKGRRKYYSLTDMGRKIAFFFSELEHPKVEHPKPEQWQIDELVSMVKDNELSEDFRYIVANRLVESCRNDPVSMVEHKTVRGLFEQVAANPPSDDKVGERLKSVLYVSISQLMGNEKTSEWVLTKLFPELARCVENGKEDEKTRVWAISRVGDIARNSPIVQDKVRDKFLEIYFAKDTELESEIAKKLKEELQYISPLFGKNLVGELKSKAKSADPKMKMKAEALLKDIIVSLSTTREPVIIT